MLEYFELPEGDGNNTLKQFCHYSTVYRGNKKICSGYNHMRNTFNGRCICFSTHAEMDVLSKLLKGEERTTI